MLIRKYNFYFYGTIGLKPSDMEGKVKLSDMSFADLVALRDELSATSFRGQYISVNYIEDRASNLCQVNNLIEARIKNIDFSHNGLC